MNVILVSLDSLRADALGCYGNQIVRTPHVDALAATGAVFENAIVQTPYTIPSHASMLTGLYPFNHQLRKQFGRKMTAKARTIFTVLKEWGYHSATFLGVSVLGGEHGYQDWNRLGSPQIGRIRRTLAGMPRPFFMFIHYWDIHVPYRVLVPAATMRDRIGNMVLRLEDLGLSLPRPLRYRLLPAGGPVSIQRIRHVADMLQSGRLGEVLEGYYRAVERADTFMGRLVDCLQKCGLLSDTLLVVTSDHGDSFNEHNEIDMAPKYPNAYVHGHFLYDNVLKVPLIWHCPEAFGHRTIGQQVEMVDVVPTLHDLLDMPPSGSSGYLDFDGVSLRGLLMDDGTAHPRQYAYSETLLGESHSVAVRSLSYKLILDFKRDSQLLFDLRSDPGETHDLSAQKPEIVTQLKEELQRIEARAQEPSSGEDVVLSDEEQEAVRRRLEALGYVE
jgi:arylsulfatase A-like enzyme